MGEFGSASAGFIAGIAAATLWSVTFESPLIREAKVAESERRTISNETMAGFYPQSYRAGDPEYLERDFEAGADLICDEILRHYERDLCATEPIRYR